jgi:hypothetical protein
MWMLVLLFYLTNYFVMAFFNVALLSAASNLLAGGHATINEGLELAWQRKGKIFQWALLLATVGIVLRMIEERTAWLGRFVGGLVGMAWNLASYFVVPVLAAEDVGPAEALQRSADLFRETWVRKWPAASLTGPGAGNFRWHSPCCALLAPSRGHQRRGTGHICRCPLPLCQDKRCLARLPRGRLLDGVAAEELNVSPLPGALRV